MPSFALRLRVLQTEHSFGSKPVPVHTAHVGQIYQVHYRFHAYFGSEVRVFRPYRRGDGVYVALERDPGVAVMAPAWVLDASFCSMLSVGPPLVSCDAVMALSDLLTSHGFRRSFDESESSKEAEDAPQESKKSSRTTSTPILDPSDIDLEPGRTSRGEASTCPVISRSFVQTRGGDQ